MKVNDGYRNAGADTSLEAIGKRVSEKRKSLKLSQDGLAEASNVSKQTISKLENGVRNAKMQTIERLAHALGVSTDYLIRGKDAPGEQASLDEIIKRLDESPYRYFGDALRYLSEILKK